MKRLIYLVLLLLPISAGAQNLSNSEKRYINSRVLSLVEEYERIASLYDDEAEYYFETLFEKGPESMVFCDMIGSESYLENIPVSEYIRQLRSYASTVTTVLKDVRKGTMTYQDSLWHIPVTLKKSFSYIDNQGYVFSVADFHNSDIEIQMHLIYDPESDTCVIRSIEGSLQSDKQFPKGRFLIIDRVNMAMDGPHLKYMSSLMIGNNSISYNEFGQAVLPSGEPTIDDIDVEVLVDTVNRGFNYDVVDFDFKQRKTRIKLRYGYSPNAFKVNNLSEDFEVKSPAMQLGFDIGFAAAGRKSKFGLYTGVGVLMSNLYLGQNSREQYSYITSRLNSSLLWESVKVNYELNSVNESVSYLDLFVPVYFEFEHRIGNYLMLSWNLGAKGYYNLKADPGEHNVSFKYSIGEVQPSSSKEIVKIFDQNFYKHAMFDASVFGNIGLDINLLKKRIYLMLRVGYEYGFMPVYKSKLAPYFNSDNPASYPIIYDLESNQHIAVQPMVNGLDYSRRGLWLSGGIKFKL